MNISDSAFFADVINAVDEVVDLRGNHGKQVRRVFERFAPTGLIDVILTAPMHQLDDLSFALYVERVSEACDMAQAAITELFGNGFAPLEQFPLSPAYRFCVVSVDRINRQYRLRVEMPAFPASMRDRQSMLDQLAHGMRRLLAMMDPRLCDPVDLTERFYEDLFRGDDSSDARELLGKEFASLVSGDFTHVATVPAACAFLAGLLNPKVNEAMSEYLAHEREVLDAAMDELDRTVRSEGLVLSVAPKASYSTSSAL